MEGQLKQRNTRVKQLSTENQEKQSEVDALRAEVERLSVQNLQEKENSSQPPIPSQQPPPIQQRQPPPISQRQSHLPTDPQVKHHYPMHMQYLVQSTE